LQIITASKGRRKEEMFRNQRRGSHENRLSCAESPIIVSSLTPYVPSDTSERDKKYDNQYVKLKTEFRTTSQTRQNTATLTNNYSPTKRESHLNRKSIVFPEYEPQKQCLYVRPKGLLQVDPSRFQITPSELTMLRGKHHVALAQVDVSTATGEVKRLATPSTSRLNEQRSRHSFKLPSTSTSVSNNDGNNGVSSSQVDSPEHSVMEDSLEDLDMRVTHSATGVRERGGNKKGFVIPLPHSTIYNKTT
jgi:hypothetical protein